MRDYWVRIYLVRHGHVQYFDDNHQPINPKFAPLSPIGKAQISLLADKLNDIEFTRAFCSTMPRSIETAEILLQSHQSVSLEAVDAIREIKSGRLREIDQMEAELQIQEAYRYVTTQQSSFIQGENWHNAEKRVLNWFEEILLLTSQSQTILISAHDVVNRLLINWMNDTISHDIYAQEQDYGCLNILDIQLEAGQVLRKRIKLQNYTVYDPLKLTLSHSAMDDLYRTYLKHNGFKESNP